MIVSLGVLANAASHWFTDNAPATALYFNPANPDARIRAVEKAISANDETQPDVENLASILTEAIRYEPHDARLYSLLGLIEEYSGKPSQTVQALYSHALALDPTDIRALIRRFAYSVSNEETGEAVRIAELVFRAWRKEWPALEPYIPELLGSDVGYGEARKRFAQLPGGPGSMLLSLAKTGDGLTIAKKLLLDWHRDGVGNLRPAINGITQRLIQAKDPVNAYLLFGLTLTPQESSEAGFVYNSSFNLDPNGSQFDWRLPRQPGVGFQIVRRPAGKGREAQDESRAMEIRFLNAPVRLAQALQTVRLPASPFIWKVTYSTRDLKGPKPLQLLLRCYPGSKPVEQLVLTATDNEPRTVSVTASVPPSDCPLQQIVVLNGNPVESWQNRYSGSLFLHEIDVQLAGS